MVMQSSESNFEVFPGSATVYIESLNYDGRTTVGTGFLIGPNDVLTAAHNIESNNQLAKEIRVYKNYNPNSSSNQYYEVVTADWFPGYNPLNSNLFNDEIFFGDNSPETRSGSELDIALLGTRQRFDGQFFELDYTFNSGSVKALGYPGAYGHNLMLTEGTASKDSVDDIFNYQLLEINPGNSGGPVFYESGGNAYAVSVVSTASFGGALSSHKAWIEEKIVANDTILPGTFSISSDASQFNEGSTASFTVQTDLPEGTVFKIQLSGLSTSDIVGPVFHKQLTKVVGANGITKIEIPIAADIKTEGNEVLTVTVPGGSASAQINDTSVFPTDTDTLVVVNSQVAQEGRGWGFQVKYSGTGKSSTDFYYEGLDSSDLGYQFELQGSIPLYGADFFPSADGRYYSSDIPAIEADLISQGIEGRVTFDKEGDVITRFLGLTFKADNITEGTETFKLNIGERTFSIDIADTTREDAMEINTAGRGGGVITAGPGNDIVDGGGGDNLIRTFGGNDKISSGLGNDTVYGGDGIDMFVIEYSYNGGGWRSDDYKNFEITRVADGGTQIKHVTHTESWFHDNGAAPHGINILYDVEKVKFAYQKSGGDYLSALMRLDVDEGETAGQAYRLYQAAFARTPDLPGVAYHMNDMESNGLSLANIANNFLNSPEFKTKYGENPTDEEYVNALYQNVLGRSADPVAEVGWYKEKFDTGAMDWSAALIGFAESPENVALVAPEIENGILFIDIYDQWTGAYG